MKIIHWFTITVIFFSLNLHVFASKAIANFPYVHSDLDGFFYVRCIPQSPQGEKGKTTLFRVKSNKDIIIDQYDWYSKKGVVLGWSPIAGKVAIMTKGGVQSPDQTKQIECGFYLGGKHLKSYSTDDLIKMGAKTTFKRLNKERRANIEFLGCKQISRSNNYVFEIKINKTTIVQFDILTGLPYKK